MMIEEDDVKQNSDACEGVKRRAVSVSCATDHNYLCGTLVTLYSFCGKKGSFRVKGNG